MVAHKELDDLMACKMIPRDDREFLEAKAI